MRRVTLEYALACIDEAQTALYKSHCTEPHLKHAIAMTILAIKEMVRDEGGK